MTTSTTPSTPTVVLVHGAFADASSWAGVIPELQSAGIDVIAPANPLRGIASDGTYIAAVVAEIPGPVLLVGHSYGGAVLTAAAGQAHNVVGLVYVAAFVLDDGESARDVLGRFPDSLFGWAARPSTFPAGDDEPRLELSLRADRYAEAFAADLPDSVTSVAAVSQRPLVAAALEEPMPVGAWRVLPSWYVVATADHMIHPRAQRFMAQRAGADTVELDASHAVAMSQPAAVAGHVRRAVTATTRAAAPR
jgi:pimeloyl-ACP methyl ester carboxylesterase